MKTIRKLFKSDSEMMSKINYTIPAYLHNNCVNAWVFYVLTDDDDTEIANEINSLNASPDDIVIVTNDEMDITVVQTFGSLKDIVASGTNLVDDFFGEGSSIPERVWNAPEGKLKYKLVDLDKMDADSLLDNIDGKDLIIIQRSNSRDDNTFVIDIR